MKEIPHGSESFRRLNLHLYGVGGLETKKPEPASAPALARQPRKHKGGKTGLHYIVTFVSHRIHLLDDDNLVGSCKALRDAVSKELGLDDGDSQIHWQYFQLETRGREGVVVTIERL